VAGRSKMQRTSRTVRKDAGDRNDTKQVHAAALYETLGNALMHVKLTDAYAKTHKKQAEAGMAL
jgi:hypothetical protein